MSPLDQASLDRVMLCWGKTSAVETEVGNFHPALFHMIDVGSVAKILLSEKASPRWRNVLADVFGDQAETIGAWLPWAIAMHDIGKISSAFQAQVEGQKVRLEGQGFKLRPVLEIHHTLIGQIHIKREWQNRLPKSILGALCDMAGGHHGQFTNSRDQMDASKRLQKDEAMEWTSLRRCAEAFLAEHFLSPDTIWPTPNNQSAAVVALCGFTVLCDWIGSNSLYFPLNNQVEPEEYLSLSLERASRAVEGAGFTAAWHSSAPTKTAALFPNLPFLRPLQVVIDRIPAEILKGACLAIIEAPTGEGKTEAALALAHRLAAYHGSDELYYALPTTATSNQMYKRLIEFLSKHLDLSTFVKLVHSQAFLIEDELAVEPLGNGRNDPMPQASIEWFSSKKRALLAPFGVGTIDQAELGALNARHNMLRLAGLAGKVLILDEVHAYDTYMTTIIERLLSWLSALGTSVIVLSATLPQSKRDNLIKAYGAPLPANPEAMNGYPCLWVGGSGQSYAANPPASQPNRRIDIHKIQMADDDPNLKAQWLLGQLGEEGCACWITNTIARAQELFSALEGMNIPDTSRLLIHSRFPMEDRQVLETQLAGWYGPKGERPKRGIVIGTQVLEQSLDLDFDLMISDLAPIDLLMQRAGRLHRHQRSRPNRHPQPVLYVNTQPGEGSLPNFRTDKVIYQEYFLLRTWKALVDRDHLDLPSDYRTLIEAVYDNSPAAVEPELAEAWAKLIKDESFARQEAEKRLLPLPNPTVCFTASMSAFLQFEENEDKASWIVAKTRLGEESITVVPLEEQGGLGRCIGSAVSFRLDEPLSKGTQLALLRRSMKLSGQDLVGAIFDQELPPAFKNSALLKNVYPLWLSHNQTTLSAKNVSIDLILDPRLGLVIRRQKG